MKRTVNFIFECLKCLLLIVELNSHLKKFEFSKKMSKLIAVMFFIIFNLLFLQKNMSYYILEQKLAAPVVPSLSDLSV